MRGSPRGREGVTRRSEYASRAGAISAVGPTQDFPRGVPGEMDAKERKRGIGNRVDQRPHQIPALGPQAQVGAAKRNDARIGRGPRHHGEAVRPGARAEQSVAGLELAGRMA